MHAAKRRTLIFNSLWFADCSKHHSKVALSLLQWNDPLVDLDEKTGKPLMIPVHPELRAILDATPSEHLTFLVTTTGKPYGGVRGHRKP
jgi:hypothetical protein